MLNGVVETRLYRPYEKDLRQQVGGNKIQPFIRSGNVVEYVGDLEGSITERVWCDAIWTDNPEQILEIYSSDCALISACDSRAMGVAHIGWKSLLISEGYVNADGYGLLKDFLDFFDKEDSTVVIGPLINSIPVRRDSLHHSVMQHFFSPNFLISSLSNPEIIQFLFRDAFVDLINKMGYKNLRISNIDTYSEYPYLASSQRRKERGEEKNNRANFLSIGLQNLYLENYGRTLSLDRK